METAKNYSSMLFSSQRLQPRLSRAPFSPIPASQDTGFCDGVLWRLRRDRLITVLRDPAASTPHYMQVGTPNIIR